MRLLSTLGVDGPAGRDGRLRHTARQGDKHQALRAAETPPVQVAYFHDDYDVIVIASNFGGAQHPGWYYNLVAHPACTLGGYAFVAREVTDETEYTRLYGVAERYYAGFADYRARTDLVGRAIPMLRLSSAPPDR